MSEREEEKLENPNPEAPLRASRRRFDAACKLKIVEEADRCTEPGQIGELLRREGLYSSQPTTWRKQRDEGALGGLQGKKWGTEASPHGLPTRKTMYRSVVFTVISVAIVLAPNFASTAVGQDVREYAGRGLKIALPRIREEEALWAGMFALAETLEHEDVERRRYAAVLLSWRVSKVPNQEVPRAISSRLTEVTERGRDEEVREFARRAARDIQRRLQLAATAAKCTIPDGQ